VDQLNTKRLSRRGLSRRLKSMAKQWFLHDYKCPECGNEWQAGDSEFDLTEDCPACPEKDVKPYRTHEV
jgi:predicted Zn-ribbon and HTH transcriptional regulator